MKNKKLLYILIPGTIIVWGIIVYRIVAGPGGGENPALQQVKIEASEQLDSVNNTFSINPHYRDPFSGQVKKIVLPISTTPQIKKITPPLATTKWPEIIYGGIVKNQKSNKQLVLVLINGQSTIMKAGESANHIELIAVWKDSIEVKFGKEKSFIKK